MSWQVACCTSDCYEVVRVASLGVSHVGQPGVLLEWRIVLLGVALFPLVMLGNWVGSLAFGKVSDPVWRACVGVVLFAAAVAALVKLL